MTGKLHAQVTYALPTTLGPPHVRDGFSAASAQRYLLVALTLPALLGVTNAGRQANLALADLDRVSAPGWRGTLSGALGVGFDPASSVDNFIHGLLIFAPLFIGAFLAAELWRRMFARRGDAEAWTTAITALLVALAVPPATAPWKLAVGISFGIVVGKEVFGGTGKNFLHPALTGLAFLYLAYPDVVRGTDVWTAVGGSRTQPPMAVLAAGGIEGLEQAGVSWWGTFIGSVPGGIGSTSSLAAIIGGALLLYARLISWRILAGAVGGIVAAALLFENLAGSPSSAVATPWYWHLNVGGFAFFLIFFATDPVTSACTNPGRWIYGATIGVMTVVIRAANPAQSEVVVLAILLGNITAPIVDYGVMQLNIRRRRQRHDQP